MKLDMTCSVDLRSRRPQSQAVTGTVSSARRESWTEGRKERVRRADRKTDKDKRVFGESSDTKKTIGGAAISTQVDGDSLWSLKTM